MAEKNPLWPWPPDHPQCVVCQHYHGNVPPTCTAFGEGIPEALWLNRVCHRARHPGDRGIRFEVAHDWQPRRDLDSDPPRRRRLLMPEGIDLDSVSDDDWFMAIGTFMAEQAAAERAARGPAPPPASIHEAVARQDMVALAEFCLSGADVDEIGPLGVPPLLQAATQRRADMVELLLRVGAAANGRSQWGYTAVHAVATSVRSSLFDLPTEAYEILTQEAIDMMELLISHGADVNSRDNFGDTPLHYAAQREVPDVVRFLVDRGADIEDRDGEGWRSLHLAASCGCAEVVRCLLQLGADAEAVTEGGRTVLHPGESKAVVHPVGETALQIAVSQGHPEVVAALRRHRVRLVWGQDAHDD